jgi:para-nitrobenzyl esterase
VTLVLAAAAVAVVAGLAVLGFPAQPRAQTAASLPACSPATVVQTGSGPVCGVTAAGQTSYLDIPYAAPPVGPLRWMPPQPVQSWTTTYQATQRGPGCPFALPGSGPAAGTSEDCLYF